MAYKPFIYNSPAYSKETINRKTTEFAMLFRLIEENISYFQSLPYFKGNIREAKDAMAKLKAVLGVVERNVINPSYSGEQSDKEALLAYSNLLNSVLNLLFMPNAQDKVTALNQVVYDGAYLIVDDEQHEKNMQNAELMAKILVFCSANRVDVKPTIKNQYKATVNKTHEFIGNSFVNAIEVAINNFKP
jgi:hypothetical protein